jgi:hypothetical protein
MRSDALGVVQGKRIEEPSRDDEGHDAGYQKVRMRSF